MCRRCVKDGQTQRHKGQYRLPKPIFSPDEWSPNTELAWAAGFFDGEGWTSVTMAKPSATRERRKYIQMGLGQANLVTLERFLAAVGSGSIYRVPNGTTRKKDYWQWSASGKKAYPAMERLWPFLSQPKKDQFERVYGEIT